MADGRIGGFAPYDAKRNGYIRQGTRVAMANAMLRATQDEKERVTNQIRALDQRMLTPEGTYTEKELYFMRQEKYALMHGINARGTFWTSKLALPHLLEARRGRVFFLRRRRGADGDDEKVDPHNPGPSQILK